MKEETIKQPTGGCAAIIDTAKRSVWTNYGRGKSTTIRVSEGTKQIIERLAKPNESADDFLFRVLSAFETHNL